LDNHRGRKNISSVIPENSVVVIDCITLWLTNFYTDTKYDVLASLALAKEQLNALKKLDSTLIIISNEIGMGLHADSEIGRKFTELQGWINQDLAKISDRATFMVSGLALQLK